MITLNLPGDFLGRLVVKTLLSVQGAQVQSLVGELRSCMLCSVAINKRKWMWINDVPKTQAVQEGTLSEKRASHANGENIFLDIYLYCL